MYHKTLLKGLIFADLMAGLKRLKLKRIGHDRFYRKFYFHNFSELRKTNLLRYCK